MGAAKTVSRRVWCVMLDGMKDQFRAMLLYIHGRGSYSTDPVEVPLEHGRGGDLALKLAREPVLGQVRRQPQGDGRRVVAPADRPVVGERNMRGVENVLHDCWVLVLDRLK